MKVWAIAVSYMCSNWGGYTVLTYMPTYLSEVMHFDHQQIGLFSALPYIGFFIFTNISGAMYDAVITRQLCSKTVARKIGNTIGTLVPGLLTIGLVFMSCTSRFEAVALLTIIISISAFVYGAGFLTNHADIAPQFAGVIFGIANTCATLPGILAPTVIGYLTTNKNGWQTAFILCVVFNTVAAVFYIIFASGEIEEWAKEPSNDGIIIKNSPNLSKS
uniref:Major facilitator superfamily (MFS) profile domain-containing protein n=3 Tax=Arion vulgaris TaxID=1028688 RepID=A0A0B6ZH59_9EUPU